MVIALTQMKIGHTILLAMLLLVTGATARLGETLGECRTRYGKESSADDANQLRIFRKGDLIIAIIFLDGKASSITYLNSVPASDQSHPPSGGQQPASRPPLSQEQIQHLLSVNRGPARTWGKSKKTGKHVIWQSSDSGRTAVHDPALHSLTIQTDAYIEHQQRIIAAREKSAAKTKPTTPSP